MPNDIYVKIAGTGSYIPKDPIPNGSFDERTFYGKDGKRIRDKEGNIVDSPHIVNALAHETGILSRRHVQPDEVASGIGFLAAKSAIEASGIDPEKLDGIYFCTNFWDVINGYPSMMPSLSSRVKEKLRISKPEVVAKDIVFGCGGWLEGVIDASDKIQAYYTRKKFVESHPRLMLVIGAETLSKVSDPYDRHSMLYADGAGAVVLEAFQSETASGILSHLTRTYSHDCEDIIYMAPSNNPDIPRERQFIKMRGRKVMRVALRSGPGVIRSAIESAGLELDFISKFLFHQSNEKLEWLIAEKLFGEGNIPKDRFPMTVSWMPNSSTATLPIMLDLMQRGKLEGHTINPGDILLFNSIGAGININALVYKVPSL